MNDEIKEIERILATSGKYITYAERCYVLDYITNLQQEKERLEENNQTMQEEMARVWEENERLKEELVKIPRAKMEYDLELEDYKSRCEKAVEYINENKHLSMFADCREPEEDWNYDLECSANDLLNILQNGSEEK